MRTACAPRFQVSAWRSGGLVTRRKECLIASEPGRAGVQEARTDRTGTVRQLVVGLGFIIRYNTTQRPLLAPALVIL